MRVGIIGTNWGRMYIGAFRAAGAEIVALAGRDARKTTSIAEAEGIDLATTDVNALCAEVDVVVVASADAMHASHITTALDHGRHVLGEKPLTLLAADAFALRDRVTSPGRGRVCAVSFSYRMLPPFTALAAALAARSPVRLIDVSLRSSFIPFGVDLEGPRMGASGDFGGASHVVDAALWLARGGPAWVDAVLDGRPAHRLTMLLGLDTGGVVHLAHTPSVRPGIWGDWKLFGDDWEAEIEAGYRPDAGGWVVSAARVFEPGRATEVAQGVAPRAGEREPWAEAHAATARAFLEAIGGGDRGALATFADGARVQAVFDAAIASDERRVRVAIAAG